MAKYIVHKQLIITFAVQVEADSPSEARSAASRNEHGPGEQLDEQELMPLTWKVIADDSAH